jgi:hypothetical protein
MDEKAAMPVVTHITGLCVSNMNYRKRSVSYPHLGTTIFDRMAYCCQDLQGLKMGQQNLMSKSFFNCQRKVSVNVNRTDKTRTRQTSWDFGDMIIEEMNRESEPIIITMSSDVPSVCVRDGGGYDNGVCRTHFCHVKFSNCLVWGLTPLWCQCCTISMFIFFLPDPSGLDLHHIIFDGIHHQ